MNKEITKLEVWFKERPLWMQDAARRLLEIGNITGDDLDQLVSLCKREAGNKIEGDETPQAIGIPDGVLQSEGNKLELRLNSISELQGINALAPRMPLEFEDAPLTIIYGLNASGKSGYVRVLKHACGARKPGILHQNVFGKTSAFQGCKFHYRIDGEDEESSWATTDGIHQDLASIELYDKDCADVYVNEENELAYEPGILLLFSQLTELCGLIDEKLQSEIASKVSKKPTMTQNLVESASGRWYGNLSHAMSAEEINKWCVWTNSNEQDYTIVKERLAEINPKEKAINLRKQKEYLISLATDFQNPSRNLSPENCSVYLTAKKDAKTKRHAATVDAKIIFENAPISGVGSDSWKLLWEQARTFSETEAYRETAFPYTVEGARCVLCHQPLEKDARKRLESFERFVKGGLEKEATKAEQHLINLQNNIGEIPTKENLTLRMDSSGITNEAERSSLNELRDNLEKQKEKLLTAEGDEKFQKVHSEDVVKFITDRVASLESQTIIYDNDAKKDNRPELQRMATDYETKKWLAEQRESIEFEIDRLKSIHELQEAQKLASTYALSLKKSTLAEDLITTAYIERFEKEIKKLGASHIHVEIVKTRTQKGRVFHKIKIKKCNIDVSAAEILSEGEFRIVSLAAFLADVEGRAAKTPFIFDDPISSLDQDFEEATVSRIIELCKNRQVIVFTHRLSMLALLQDAAKKVGLTPRVVALRREPWGAGEPGETPLSAQKPKKAINTLLDRVEKACELLYEKGQAKYDEIAKGICSDVRITLERLIENDLLADVIQRYRRSITTKGKLHKLARITPKDCKLLDDFITLYSKYEHSQPNETPVNLPDPDQLRTDLEKIKAWRDEFDNRSLSLID